PLSLSHVLYDRVLHAPRRRLLVLGGAVLLEQAGSADADLVPVDACAHPESGGGGDLGGGGDGGPVGRGAVADGAGERVLALGLGGRGGAQEGLLGGPGRLGGGDLRELGRAAG